MSSDSSPPSTLITPEGPTLLDGVSEFEIDALDAFGYNAANSYIVPELIDVPRFTAALRKALVLFPVYAARVRCGEGGSLPWKLTLPPLGIPLSVLESEETSLFPIEAVVQKPFPFLPPLNPRKIVLDPETPLAAIRLTLFPNIGKTSIGIIRWHPIGSDHVASRFIRALSKLYVALDAPLDEPEPVYRAARTYLPAPQPALLHGVDTHAVEAYYPSSSTHPQLNPLTNVRLDFRLTGTQVKQLREAIQARGGVDAGFVSAQDCLAALVAVAINAADPETPPIHTIDTILDVRGAAGIPTELAFNGFTFAPTDRVDVNSLHEGQDEYYAYAAAVRRSIVRGRDPAFLSALVDLQARRAEEAAGRGELMDLASPPGHMICNSTLRLDTLMRPHIHFGHTGPGQGQVRSYVGTVPFLRHLKLARPNEGLDKTEVTLCFQPTVRGRFIKEVEERVRGLGVQGEVEWVAGGGRMG